MANYDIGTATGATDEQIATAIKGVVDSGLSSSQIAGALVNGGGGITLSVSGVAEVGEVLTASLPSTYGAASYQWMRGGVNISGATSSTYTLVSADSGTQITVKAVGVYVVSSGVSVEVEPSAMLQINTNLVFEGDSITQQGAYVQVASGEIDGVCLLSSGYNQGVSGQTSGDALLGIDTTLAVNPEVCVVFLGTNDLYIYHADASSITSNLRGIYDALLGINSVVVAITLHEYSGISTTDNATRIEVNNWINAQTDITVCDISGFDKTIHLADAVHPNWLGAEFIGVRLASVLSTIVESGDILSGYLSPTAKLVVAGANPAFIGSGGSHYLNRSSGELADNWALLANGISATATTVSSKTVVNDAVAQVLNISGTNTVAGVVTFQISVGGLTEAERYYSALEYSLTSTQGLGWFTLKFGNETSRYQTSDSMQPCGLRVIRSPLYTVPAGVVRADMIVTLYVKSGEVDINLIMSRPFVGKILI